MVKIMKVSELNEEMQLSSPPAGITIFVDKRNKTFRLATDRDRDTQEINSLMDYRKVAKRYDMDVSTEDWIKLKKDAKGNRDRSFQQALASMEKDLKEE